MTPGVSLVIRAAALTFLVMALAFAAGFGLPRMERNPSSAAGSCPHPAKSMARLELLFGTTRKGGGTVGEAEWLDFLAAEVTPRFPDGLTAFAGYGQWRNAQGDIAKETARMLLIWHVPGPATAGDIEAIRTAYKRRFEQDSVMRVDGASCVAF